MRLQGLLDFSFGLVGDAPRRHAGGVNALAANVTVTLESKNKVPLFADHLSFDGSIEGAPVVHSTLTQRVTLPAQGKADVKVPLRFVYKELKGAKAAMEGKKWWNYVLTGEIGFAPYESLLIIVRRPSSTHPRFPCATKPATARRDFDGTHHEQGTHERLHPE